MDICHACRLKLPQLTDATHCCALPIGALPTRTDARVCPACCDDPPPWDSARALLPYTAPFDRLHRGFKFGRDRGDGALLAQLLLRQLSQDPALLPAAQTIDAWVPIPLHRRRLRQRGFNQASELLRPLAEYFSAMPNEDLLHRCRATSSQATLPARQRAVNVSGAFSARSAAGLRVLLFDDVMTTGHTLRAATLALRQTGAVEVHVCVAFRSFRPPPGAGSAVP